MKNLLLIDSAVQEFTTFVNSVNSDTIPFVYSSRTTNEDVLDFIGEATIDRLGIVFHNTGLFLGDPFYSELNTVFFIETIRQCQLKHIDFLACNTLREERWKTFYDNLHYETGVIVGASDNPTGNLKYGGDWVLESTGEDIELIYFTNTIQYYKFLLVQSFFSMVVKNDGTLWGTGDNSAGQLGDGTSVSKSAFFNITSFQITDFKNNKIKTLAYGSRFTIVLMNNNTLWFTGQLINNPTLFTNISFSGTIVSIACGTLYAVFYKTDNTLWGCGNNSYGQLGLPQATTSVSTFTQLSGFTGTIKAIACGDNHMIVLTTSNKLWVTGYNLGGQLGVGDTTNRYSLTVVNIDTLSGKIPDIISAGEFHTIIAMTDGSLWGCGQDSNFGNGQNSVLYKTFTEVSNVNNYYNGKRKVNKISCGHGNTLVLMSDGIVWAAGSNYYYSFGNNLDSSPYFFKLTTPTTIRSIFGCRNHTLLLGIDNKLYGAGNNLQRQLGYATPDSISTFLNPLSSVSLLSYDISFSAVPAIPTITNITQSANGLITIFGSNYVSPIVTMTGGYTSETVTVVSSTQLTFTPSAFIGSSTFTVSDGGNSVSLTASFPNITSFTPIQGDINTLVTITGTNLANVTSVLFGTVTATSPSISPTTITANAPSNNTRVFITLTDSNGNSVSTITTYLYNNTYNTAPPFKTSTTDLFNKLVSQATLKYGVTDTGILQIGSVGTTTNLSGTINGITVSSTDNSSRLATTSFVKSQTSIAQAWNILQGFTSGIVSSTYNALTPSSTLWLGNNLTTGIVNIGSSMNSSGTINIGTSTSITNISNMSCNNLSCQSIEPVIENTNFNVAINQINGQLLLGDGLNRTGNVKIGNRISGPLGTYSGALSLGANIVNASIFIGSSANGPGISTISIGNTYTTTNLRGATMNIYSPMTNVYTMSTNSFASLAYIGGSYTVSSTAQYNFTTSYKAQVPINNIPTGRYCVSMYVYVTQASPIGRYETRTCYNDTTAITANSTTGFTLIGDGILETYIDKPTNTNAMHITSTSILDVLNNAKIAIACLSTVNSENCNFRLTATRVA